ncbi:MAG: DUF916 domain-containing protein [Anaerolineae bacterium]|nr:DUF916 domain-containing protein [Anaerolineae bacterium]
MALTIIPVAAQSSANISFGIRPTKAIEGQEETFSYFSYHLSPGTVFNDEALVMNDGDEAIILKIYAADGMTPQNGGTGFSKAGELSSGMSRGTQGWITLSATEVTLSPGEERLIPFQVSIPADIGAGQYVAGLVVEALPDEQSSGLGVGNSENPDEAQFAVKVVRRVGVAVVFDIPGEQIAGLEIKDISLAQQDDDGATFAIELKNTGNIFFQTQGFFIVTDRDAERVITTTPLDFDTILPGDTISFFVPRSARFADGKYLLSIVLEYEGKRAILEGIGMNIKDGQPQIEGQILDNLFTAEDIEVFFAKEEKGSSFNWLVIAGISFLLALGVGGFVFWAGGKKENTA